MSMQHDRKWCREFESGRTNTHNDDRACRPSVSWTDVNAAREVELIVGKRRVTIRDLSSALKLFIGNVHNIFHVEIGYPKVYASWVPIYLTQVKEIDVSRLLFHIFSGLMKK